MSDWPWSALNLDGPAPQADIRRAYARALKQIDQKTAVAGFTTLRSAYEAALNMAGGAVAKRPRVRAEAVAQNLAAAAQVAPPAPAKTLGAQDEADITRLLASLHDDTATAGAGQRICAALADPLAQDPEVSPRLRAAIAGVLRENTFDTGEAGRLRLSSPIDAKTLRALDARFGWLSDYAAYRRDWGFDPRMLDLMATRANGTGMSAQRPIASHPSDKSRMPFAMIFLVISVALAVLRALPSGSSQNSALVSISNDIAKCSTQSVTDPVACLQDLIDRQKQMIERQNSAADPAHFANPTSYPR